MDFYRNFYSDYKLIQDRLKSLALCFIWIILFAWPSVMMMAAEDTGLLPGEGQWSAFTLNATTANGITDHLVELTGNIDSLWGRLYQ